MTNRVALVGGTVFIVNDHERWQPSLIAAMRNNYFAATPTHRNIQRILKQIEDVHLFHVLDVIYRYANTNRLKARCWLATGKWRIQYFHSAQHRVTCAQARHFYTFSPRADPLNWESGERSLTPFV